MTHSIITLFNNDYTPDGVKHIVYKLTDVQERSHQIIARSPSEAILIGQRHKDFHPVTVEPIGLWIRRN